MNPPYPQNNKKRKEQVSLVSQYSGPIPDPRSMEHYENILPGSANRLITMVENQANHRIKLESRVTTWNLILDTIGLIFAFLIILAIVIGAFYLMYKGKSWTGLTLGVPAVAIAAYFITRKHKKQ